MSVSKKKLRTLGEEMDDGGGGADSDGSLTWDDFYGKSQFTFISRWTKTLSHKWKKTGLFTSRFPGCYFMTWVFVHIITQVNLDMLIITLIPRRAERLPYTTNLLQERGWVLFCLKNQINSESDSTRWTFCYSRLSLSRVRCTLKF